MLWCGDFDQNFFWMEENGGEIEFWVYKRNKIDIFRREVFLVKKDGCVSSSTSFEKWNVKNLSCPMKD